MHYLTERVEGQTGGQDLAEEDLKLREARLSASSRPPLARLGNVGVHRLFSSSQFFLKV